MNGIVERPIAVGAQARTGAGTRATASGRCVKVVVHFTTRLMQTPNHVDKKDIQNAHDA
jgi:hypothetical protein